MIKLLNYIIFIFLRNSLDFQYTLVTVVTVFKPPSYHPTAILLHYLSTSFLNCCLPRCCSNCVIRLVSCCKIGKIRQMIENISSKLLNQVFSHVSSVWTSVVKNKKHCFCQFTPLLLF